MEIKITVYKASGKFYTSDEICHNGNIPEGTDEFLEFVKAHLPARCEGGYAVVEDLIENDSFHRRLYKIDELLS